LKHTGYDNFPYQKTSKTFPLDLENKPVCHNKTDDIKMVIKKLSNNSFVWACVLCFFLFHSCKSKNTRPEISFYYWKTKVNLNETEKNALIRYKVKKLYIRYFDVDLHTIDSKPFPVSPVSFDSLPINYTIVPVVFIKNKVMLYKNLDIKGFCNDILSYIEQINKKAGIAHDEIQIDCDWSLDSRDRFMKFIDTFKIQSGKKVSVTIRLHQVKYFYKTKVPAADYGVLMYYNMGQIAAEDLNSVYDREIAKKYLNSLATYPLHLDIALPVFKRGIQTRGNQVLNLISKIDDSNFANDSNFTIINKHLIIAKNPNFKFGFYFKQDDEIKIESVCFEQLVEMSEDLGRSMAHKPQQIIFFDLDSINLNSYNDENQTFEKILRYF
jgi:hypothetical protein